MYIICFQIANWLLRLLLHTETAHRHFVKSENTLKQITIKHHHLRHATECVFISRIKY